MTWTNIPNTDIDNDSPLNEDLFDALRDNLRECRSTLVPFQYAEQSTTSATYVTLVTIGVYIPDLTSYTGLQRTFQLVTEARVSANNGDFRLTTSLDNGAAVNVTATSYTDITISVDIDSSFVDTVVPINLQARQNTSGTAFSQSVNRVAGLLDY